MPPRTRAVDRGNANGRRLVADLARELETARLAAGLSYAELARSTGLSSRQVARICQGRSPSVSVVRVAELLPIVGLTLSAKAFPDGAPVRDRAHLAVLDRFRRRLHPSCRWRVEVPVVELSAGGPPDLRAWDAAIDGTGVAVRVEAETHVHDVQALVRRLSLKQRDGHIAVVVLVLADTVHHRKMVAAAGPGLRAAFPVGTRGAFAALRRCRSPGANALVLV